MSLFVTKRGFLFLSVKPQKEEFRMKKFIITMMMMVTAVMAVGCTISADSVVDESSVIETEVTETEAEIVDMTTDAEATTGTEAEDTTEIEVEDTTVEVEDSTVEENENFQ